MRTIRPDEDDGSWNYGCPTSLTRHRGPSVKGAKAKEALEKLKAGRASDDELRHVRDAAVIAAKCYRLYPDYNELKGRIDPAALKLQAD